VVALLLQLETVNPRVRTDTPSRLHGGSTVVEAADDTASVYLWVKCGVW
jgi:hypothetical protein